MALDQLRDLQAEIGRGNAERGFHGAAETPETHLVDYYSKKLLLVVGEAVEAQEELRAGHGVTEEYLSYPATPASLASEFASGQEATEYFRSRTPGKPEGVPSELADIVIRVLDLADEAGIDLATVIESKLEYNNTRAFRHGKAF